MLRTRAASSATGEGTRCARVSARSFPHPAAAARHAVPSPAMTRGPLRSPQMGEGVARSRRTAATFTSSSRPPCLIWSLAAAIVAVGVGEAPHHVFTQSAGRLRRAAEARQERAAGPVVHRSRGRDQRRSRHQRAAPCRRPHRRRRPLRPALPGRVRNHCRRHRRRRGPDRRPGRGHGERRDGDRRSRAPGSPATSATTRSAWRPAPRSTAAWRGAKRWPRAARRC